MCVCVCVCVFVCVCCDYVCVCTVAESQEDLDKATEMINNIVDPSDAVSTHTLHIPYNACIHVYYIVYMCVPYLNNMFVLCTSPLHLYPPFHTHTHIHTYTYTNTIYGKHVNPLHQHQMNFTKP